MLIAKPNCSTKLKNIYKLKIPSYPSLQNQEIITGNMFKVVPSINHSLVKPPTITNNILWKPSTESTEEIDTVIKDTSKSLGFIILRCITNSLTNEYWKECYRCIRNFYPNNRILIVDDNSNKQYVTNDKLHNTMIIESEFPKRGEFLPYYYYLRTRFCEKVVILHDSMFMNKYINFNSIKDEYKILIHFEKKFINEVYSFTSQQKLLKALNHDSLYNFYNKKDLNYWTGCFGGMSFVSYNYLKDIDNEFRLLNLIPVITSRVDRCAFERIIGCLLQYKIITSSLLGNILPHNLESRLTYYTYKKNQHKKNVPLINIFSGR